MNYTFTIKINREIEINANSEDSAWEKLEELINTEEFENEIELSNVDASDEWEREERAKDEAEARMVDEYIERQRGII